MFSNLLTTDYMYRFFVCQLIYGIMFGCGTERQMKKTKTEPSVLPVFYHRTF